MKVLVTGAHGAIGRRLVAALGQRPGFSPVSLVSPRAGGGPGQVAVDVGDPFAFRAVLADVRPDAVVHLAALTGAACDVDPELTEAVNVGSAVTLAEAQRDAGIGRIVFVSTSAVYGDQYDRPADESAPLRLGTSYASSKHRAEQALAAATTGDSVSLRVFNMFGPGTPNSLVTRLLEATPGRPVPLRGPDNFVRDYVHIDDVTAAIVSALAAPLPQQHSVFNIGSGIATSNRDLVRELGIAEQNYTVTRSEASYSCARIEAARQWLDFQPVHLLRDAGRAPRV